MTQTGIFFSNISAGVLRELTDIGRERLLQHAPKLCSWLAEELRDEISRRARQQQRQEPSELKFSCQLWSDAEVGSALRALWECNSAVRSLEAVEVLDKLFSVIVKAAAGRLQK